MLELGSWLQRPSTPFELRHASTDRPFFVNVPPRRFLVIEGSGQRQADDFTMATTILREVHLHLRSRLRHDAFAVRAQPILEVRSVVPPGLTAMELAELLEARDDLRWAQMLELPDTATAALAHQAIDHVRSSAGRQVPLVHLIVLEEGPSVQLLRVGESDRVPAIVRLFEVVASLGFHDAGLLHELLLTDPSRVPAYRSRTIVRLPVAH
jgi:hypothetical protein